MVFSNYAKQRILFLSATHKSPTIAKILHEEGIKASRRGILKFIRRYERSGTIHRLPGSGRVSKITEEIKAIVEEQMRADDETTAVQLHKLLNDKGYTISLRTVLRCRVSLGWTFRGSSYCQLIRGVNKEKRLTFARQILGENFNNVIFTDECSIQAESHRRFCCRKRGEPPRNKPRPKHPLKVHIWAGISIRGPTAVCIFEGRLNAPLFVQILDKTLLPFIKEVFPAGHRFMQDNDPKHCSKRGVKFIEDHGVNWWRTPPKSPDLNPIENLWHELKEFIRWEVKPKTKDELVSGILQFWATVDFIKCKKYIRHLDKVVPKVIELNGDATGY